MAVLLCFDAKRVTKLRNNLESISTVSGTHNSLYWLLEGGKAVVLTMLCFFLLPGCSA